MNAGLEDQDMPLRVWPELIQLSRKRFPVDFCAVRTPYECFIAIRGALLDFLCQMVLVEGPKVLNGLRNNLRKRSYGDRRLAAVLPGFHVDKGDEQCLCIKSNEICDFARAVVTEQPPIVRWLVVGRDDLRNVIPREAEQGLAKAYLGRIEHFILTRADGRLLIFEKIRPTVGRRRKHCPAPSIEYHIPELERVEDAILDHVTRTVAKSKIRIALC